MTISENFPHIAQSVKAHESVEITGEVYVGENCQLLENVKLRAYGARLIICDNVTVSDGSEIWSDKERTRIGDNVSIGDNCNISCSIGEDTTIEDNVTIASDVFVGKGCLIKSNQALSNLKIPDNSTVENGEIK